MSTPLNRNQQLPGELDTKCGTTWTSEDRDACINWLLEENRVKNLLLMAARYSEADHNGPRELLHSFYLSNLDLVIKNYDTDKGSSFWLYLRTCFKNFCLGYRRKAKRLIERELSIDEDFDRGTTYALHLKSQPNNGHLDSGMHNRAIVQTALNSISPRFAEIIVARYFLEKTEAQIAADMGVPLGTVKTWLHRARLQMKIAIERTSTSRHKGSEI